VVGAIPAEPQQQHRPAPPIPVVVTKPAPSILLAPYGMGSITGGFDVILRITPGAELADVTAAYADQANQFEGEPILAPR
jgi:hypothetical protein